MSKQRSKMDVESYDKGVLDLPSRLRVLGMTNAGVNLNLNEEQALLLADDVERGIATRSIDFRKLRATLTSFAQETGNADLKEAAEILAGILRGPEEIANRVPDPRKKYNSD